LEEVAHLRTVIAAAVIAVGSFGLAAAGIRGAITGVIAAIAVSSGIAIAVGKSSESGIAQGSVGRIQRTGGLLAAAFAAIGAWTGGWRWGWFGAGIGYLGAVAIVGASGLISSTASRRRFPAREGAMQLVTSDEFFQATMGGRPNRLNMAPYEGVPFQCACGQAHPYHASAVPVLRELRGMRLVLPCPVTERHLTCVKVKGFFRFKGFESLFGAEIEDDNEDDT
jgi:hypothetical protein